MPDNCLLSTKFLGARILKLSGLERLWEKRKKKLLRCVALMNSMRLSDKKHCIRVRTNPILRAVGEGWDWQNMLAKNFWDRAVVSHPSPRAQDGAPERWWGRKREKDRPLMGLRPAFINPRTLVRTWGTQSVWTCGEEWPRHGPSLLAARCNKSGYARGRMFFDERSAAQRFVDSSSGSYKVCAHRSGRN